METTVYIGVAVIGVIFALLAWCVLFMDTLIEQRKDARESQYGRTAPGCLVRVWWGVDWLVRFGISSAVYLCAILLPMVMYMVIYPILVEVNINDFTFRDVKVAEADGVIQFSPEEDLDPETGRVTDAARERIETELGGEKKLWYSTWEALTEYGHQLSRQKARANDEEPPTLSDAEAELLALTRLSGQDEEFKERYKNIVAKVHEIDYFQEEDSDGTKSGHLDNLQLYAMLCHIFYPNDQVGFAIFAGDWGEEELDHEPSMGEVILGLSSVASMFVLFALVVQRGMRKITVSLFGRILFLKDDSTFEDYREAVFNPYRMMITTLVVTLLSFAAKLVFLDAYSILYITTFAGLFVAVLWSALMGGVLVESIGNVVTLLFIRIGRDPLETWWDNIITGILGFMVLAMAFNGPSSILSGVLLGSATSLIYKWVGRH